MEPTIAQAKRAMRDAARHALAAVSDEDARDWSHRIVAAIAGTHAYDAATVVMVYSAIPGEVDLSALARDAIARGKTVCWPRSNWAERSMEAVAMPRYDWADAGLGVTVQHGIVEPGPTGTTLSVESLAASPLLALVPGLAFDANGGRLGRGAGFYDRFLSRLAATRPRGECETGDRAGRGQHAVFGVCFGCLIVDRVPMSPDDVAMDGVVSEGGVMLC